MNEKVWDDIKDLEELSSFPDTALHRPIEKVVLHSLKAALATPPSVRTAIISPGQIGGRGTSPDRIFTSLLINNIIISTSVGVIIGIGVSTMTTAHVQDLPRLYVMVLGEALKPNGGATQWDAEGYYFDDETAAQHVALAIKAFAAIGKTERNKVET